MILILLVPYYIQILMDFVCVTNCPALHLCRRRPPPIQIEFGFREVCYNLGSIQSENGMPFIHFDHFGITNPFRFPVGRHRKRIILKSNSSPIQISFIARTNCITTASCRRSSPALIRINFGFRYQFSPYK
jgi:hypothetical protein